MAIDKYIMDNDPVSHYYYQASVCGATPIGMVIALYDTVLRGFVRALAALQAGDIESRVFHLNHALTVIGQLQCTLDHERGGEPAKHLANFYNITRGMIVDANIRATPKAIEELVGLYGGLREAWFQAEQQLAANQQPRPEGDPPIYTAKPPAVNTADDDIVVSQLRWSG